VDLNQSRTRRGSRWPFPGRARTRGRHARGRNPSLDPDPSPVPVAFPVFQACPVMAGESHPGLDASSALTVDRWSLPDHGPSALDCLLVSARRFITLYYTENRLGSPDERLQQARREIEATGTYWHTQDELTFGARVAWRNSARCIGRLYWNSLRVRDRREITSARDIAEEAATHLREATNGGRIRPTITVFAPDAPGRPGPRILSSQLVRYAGYEIADGVVIGDPSNTVLTRIAEQAGWPGAHPAGRFDILPLLVQEAGRPVSRHELPADAILEVAIEHPEFGWFSDLGLRWHAVPVISDMYLDIGGVCYPAAPFNGWYMGTEVGSRNLGDIDRYNQLPIIAAHMGLSTEHDRTLWKDKALTELNLAVLHSFAAAGVSVTDHHSESVRFLKHIEREERHGRACPADWSWIVPPAASSATPVFHRYYQDFDQTPNFYRHPALVAPPSSAQERATRQAASKATAARPAPRREIAAQASGLRPSVARELASKLVVRELPSGPSAARELVSKLVIQEPAPRQPTVQRPASRPSAAWEQMSGLLVRGPVARELASRPPAVQEPAPRQPAAQELASRLPAAQEPASKGPAAPELASGPPTTLDVVVEGSATIHDHLRPARGICPRAGGDLRR
jgi:nitric-oxide synthase, bacterial